MQVWNPSFDVAPAKLIAGIITEKGVVPKHASGDSHAVGDFLADHGLWSGAANGSSQGGKEAANGSSHEGTEAANGAANGRTSHTAGSNTTCERRGLLCVQTLWSLAAIVFALYSMFCWYC